MCVVSYQNPNLYVQSTINTDFIYSGIDIKGQLISLVRSLEVYLQGKISADLKMYRKFCSCFALEIHENTASKVEYFSKIERFLVVA